MKVYILKRIVMLVPVLLGVSVVVFLLIHFTPGDPARVMAGERASPEVIAAMRAKWGLDKPLPEQYFIWLGKALRGDLGRSIVTRSSVISEIWDRFPNTVELTLAAMVIAILVGVVAGILSATKQYSIVDYGSMVGALFGISMPVFWLGLMLMFVFGLILDWFPISGRLDTGITLNKITHFYVIDSLLTGNWLALKSTLSHLILPALALGTIPMAMIARMTRSSMLEVIRQDYIRTERAKGLSEKAVIYKHALKNALIPIITVIGLNFGLLLGGAILTETVFSWPGLGRYAVQAVYARDYPAIQGSVLFIAITFVIVNLITDIIYAYVNPKIRYG